MQRPPKWSNGMIQIASYIRGILRESINLNYFSIQIVYTSIYM